MLSRTMSKQEEEDAKQPNIRSATMIRASKMFIMSNYELIVLLTGYSNESNDGVTANCTCTLLKSPTTKIIIDTRTPWDGEDLIAALTQQELTINDINYCISTHGHSDHVGCNYLFKNALHFVGKNCISRNNTYYNHDFKNPYEIDEDIKIISTPGHTSECLSVLANTKVGIVAIVGDLFEKEEDLYDENLWKCNSEFPKLQQKSRQAILDTADYIVPGHGDMFKNPFKISVSRSRSLSRSLSKTLQEQEEADKALL